MTNEDVLRLRGEARARQVRLDHARNLVLAAMAMVEELGEPAVTEALSRCFEPLAAADREAQDDYLFARPRARRDGEGGGR